MADAFTRASQRLPNDPERAPTSTLQVAHEANLSVVTSASLGGGDLTTAGSIPAGVDATLAGDTSAQRALNFARSAPAVRCSLVGTTDTDHLRENVAAGTFDPLGAAAFDAVFA
jgi:aryl-alcohol dehydrogenase-like predicted oxidoreductase